MTAEAISCAREPTTTNCYNCTHGERPESSTETSDQDESVQRGKLGALLRQQEDSSSFCVIESVVKKSVRVA